MNMKTEFIHFKSVDSTNAWAMAHCIELDRNAMTVVSADGQTAGRGRYGRKWESPPDAVNLYATFGIFLDVERNDYALLTVLLALAAEDILGQYGLEATLKWPNDLLVEGKKIAGILCEAKVVGKERFVALGIGVNINASSEQLQGLSKRATSLYQETGELCSVDEFLQLLTKSFGSYYEQFVKEGLTDIVYEKLQSSFVTEKIVQFSQGEAVFRGKIKAFNRDGSITFELENGEERQVYSGEILS